MTDKVAPYILADICEQILAEEKRLQRLWHVVRDSVADADGDNFFEAAKALNEARILLSQLIPSNYEHD